MSDIRKFDDVALARWREFVSYQCAVLQAEIEHFQSLRAQFEADLAARKYKRESEGKVKHRINLISDQLMLLTARQQLYARLLVAVHAELDRRGYPKSEWIDLAIRKGIDG